MLLVAFPGVGCADPTPIPVVSPHWGNAGWGAQILLRKAELTFELRAEQMLHPLLWVILTWEGFSAEHCSASREPQSEVKEVMVKAEAGLKEIQKSASAGEQSQVTTSSREKKKPKVVGLQMPPLAFSPEEKQNSVPCLLLLQLIVALPAFQQLLINSLFIFHMMSVFKLSIY